jgi:ATP-dependent DNA helicase RecG
LPHIGFAESDQVDFKESWGAEALENLASFANTRGGVVYVGVDQRGRLIGTDVSDAQQLRIASQTHAALNIAPDIRAERHHGVDVLAVRVGKATYPVLLRGSLWGRSGTASSKIPPDQWAGRILEQAGRSWDSLPAPAELRDVDPEAVARFIRAAKRQDDARLPSEVPDDSPAETILRSLKLAAAEQVTNAALLLFGADPQRRFPSARVRIARFRSIDDFTPYPDVAGTVLDQIEQVMRVLQEHNPARARVVEPPPGPVGVVQRRETPTYPVLALREAVVNAVIHRDYLSPAPVQIRIWDDRVEVWNPGGLLPGVTVETLYQPAHPSVPRNPLVANTAYVARLLEGWGTGTVRMVERCRAAGLPSPAFAEIGGGFMVTLFGDRLAPEELVRMGLNERQIAAVAHLKTHGRITSGEYRRLTGAGRTTAAEELARLQAQGIVERHGTTGRGTFYTLRDLRHPTPAPERTRDNRSAPT